MDTATSDIPKEVADIIIDLNILSRVPLNHKLNTTNKTYVSATSYTSVPYRWWNDESGINTAKYINEKIDKAIAVGRKYPEWVKHLADCVNNLSTSLLNLIYVYKTDKDERAVAELELIQTRIIKDFFLRACAKKVPTQPNTT